MFLFDICLIISNLWIKYQFIDESNSRFFYFSIQMPRQLGGSRVVSQSSIGDSNYPIDNKVSTAHQSSS